MRAPLKEPLGDGRWPAGCAAASATMSGPRCVRAPRWPTSCARQEPLVGDQRSPASAANLARRRHPGRPRHRRLRVTARAGYATDAPTDRRGRPAGAGVVDRIAQMASPSTIPTSRQRRAAGGRAHAASLTIVGEQRDLDCECATTRAAGRPRDAAERGNRRLRADAELSGLLADRTPQVQVEARFGVNAVEVRRGETGIVTTARRRRRRSRASRCSTARHGTVNKADLRLGAARAGRPTARPARRPTRPRCQTPEHLRGRRRDRLPCPGVDVMEQARIAMCHAFDLKYKTRLSLILPLGIYTIPELTMVGLTEESAATETCSRGRPGALPGQRARADRGRRRRPRQAAVRARRRADGGRAHRRRTRHRADHVASTGLALGATIGTFIDAVYDFPTLPELYKYAAYDALGKIGSACLLYCGREGRHENRDARCACRCWSRSARAPRKPQADAPGCGAAGMRRPRRLGCPSQRPSPSRRQGSRRS